MNDLDQRVPKDLAETPSATPTLRPRSESVDASNSTQVNEKRGSEIGEKSPNERYIRSNDIISETPGATLISYKAFDSNNGVEIAWHKINLASLEVSEQERLTYCIDVIKLLESEVLIRYLDIWYSDDNTVINIITTNLELLSEFVSKVKTLRWRIVKKWCRQFLTGLQILHTHAPAIIHRHFSFAHIYIDGGLGATTIGDLWLAAIMAKDSDNVPHQMGLSEAVTKSLTRMPQTYTAPELFEGKSLTTKVKIAFSHWKLTSLRK